MLSKQERFSRSQFTDFLANKGVLVVYNRLGTLKYLPGVPRAFSVVTSSKHEKKAVSRNKLRRRVYSLFQAQNPAFAGILYTAKGSFALTYPEIKTFFNELLTKAHTQSTQTAK